MTDEEFNTLLPEFAMVKPPHGEPVLVKRGEQGYWPSHGFDMAEFNARHKVTVRQQSAMLMGSLFGFDVPGADPRHEMHDKAEGK